MTDRLNHAPFTQVLEHDDIYHVKKVSNFVLVDGELVRQTGQPATEETLVEVKNALSDGVAGGGIPANKATDAYGYQARSITATYKYFFYEDGNGNWYILRKDLATGVVTYARGTGGYETVFVDATSAPGGSPTFGTYDETFENVGASSLAFDVAGNLKTALVDVHGHEVNVQAVTASIDGTEYGVVTNAIIHGKSTAGGGTWVDVKVSPSGAVQVGGTLDTIDELPLPSGASTSANQTNGNQIAKVYVVDELGVQSQMLGDNIYAGAPVTIDVEHHEIHCGDSFMACRSVSLGNGASDTIIVNVPNETGNPQKLYHFVADLFATAEVTVQIYEGATTSEDGTSITNYNRNRNSILTSSLALTHTPTNPSGGTLICEKHIGSGRLTSGETRGEKEIILKNNTKYRVVVTNQITNTNNVSWELNHYIHPGI